jgi:hypothetical protein
MGSTTTSKKLNKTKANDKPKRYKSCRIFIGG